MADKEELQMLQKTYNDLQDYYSLLRLVRNDIEKMISNFSCAPDFFPIQKDVKAGVIKESKKIPK